jgi:DNA-binding HxlR family transcriptional regulator
LAESCGPARVILSRVGDKWSMLVVIALRDGALRFNEIKRVIGAISQRMLTLTLRGMERDGLVKRTVTPTRPPRVDYELTALGHSLREPIEVLGQWAVEHQGEIDAARKRFDRRKTAA